MTRLEDRLRSFGIVLLLTASAVVLLVSDHRVHARHTPGPLHVASLWWSPEAMRQGVHSLHGRVVNTTDTTWENVQVSIDFRDVHGESLFVRTVPLGRVPPGEPTEFATGPVPMAPRSYELIAITGTMREEWPLDVTRRGRPRTRSRAHRRAPPRCTRPDSRSCMPRCARRAGHALAGHSDRRP